MRRQRNQLCPHRCGASDDSLCDMRAFVEVPREIRLAGRLDVDEDTQAASRSRSSSEGGNRCTESPPVAGAGRATGRRCTWTTEISALNQPPNVSAK